MTGAQLVGFFNYFNVGFKFITVKRDISITDFLMAFTGSNIVFTATVVPCGNFSDVININPKRFFQEIPILFYELICKTLVGFIFFFCSPYKLSDIVKESSQRYLVQLVFIRLIPFQLFPASWYKS